MEWGLRIRLVKFTYLNRIGDFFLLLSRCMKDRSEGFKGIENCRQQSSFNVLKTFSPLALGGKPGPSTIIFLMEEDLFYWIKK